MLTFDELNIGEKFAFQHEIDWYNLNLDKNQFSKHISYVPVLEKISNEIYVYYSLLADSRRVYKPIKKFTGIAHANAYVYRVTENEKENCWAIYK